MPSYGPMHPTSENDGGGFAISWSGTSSVFLSDDKFTLATRLTAGTAETDYLVGLGYRFQIPDNATIDGIEVSIEKKRGTFSDGSAGTGDVVDRVVRLWTGGLAGAFVGDDKADTGTSWPTVTDSVVTYGGPSDPWGLSLTPADVNDSGFGAGLRATVTNVSEPYSAYVDCITITVYYTVPSRNQEGYRWRNDDGSESAATWLQSQDTPITRAKQTATRLRVLTDMEVGEPLGEGLKLQYRKQGSTDWHDIGG